MVAEKPSIALAIAKVLSQNRYKSRKGIARPQIHCFQGFLKGQKSQFKVTSVTGHVFTSEFPPGYQNWQTTDPYDLFDVEILKIESDSRSRMVQHLSNEAKNVDFLILWLDCDREGENICFEVIQCCEPYMHIGERDNILRAKFSSITPPDLKKAFSTLSEGPDYNQSIAVDARQEIDLKIGVALSRFQTLYFQEKYEDLSDSMITFGPC